MCLRCRSLWSKKSDSNGSQWTGRSICKSEADARVKRQGKTEDKDGAIQSLSCLEWNVFVVSLHVCVLFCLTWFWWCLQVTLLVEANSLESVISCIYALFCSWCKSKYTDGAVTSLNLTISGSHVLGQVYIYCNWKIIVYRLPVDWQWQI